MRTATRFLQTFAAGAGLGTVLDQIHIHYGVLSYAHPTWFGQSWWASVLYGAASVVFVALAARVRRIFPSTDDHRLVGSIAALLAAYWVSGVWQAYPIALALTLGLLLLLHTTSAVVLAFSALLAITATACEIGLVHTGALLYHYPDMLGIPYWLPALYLQAAPAVLALAAWHHERSER